MAYNDDDVRGRDDETEGAGVGRVFDESEEEEGGSVLSGEGETGETEDDKYE